MQLSPTSKVDNLNDGIPKSTINIELRSFVQGCVAYATGVYGTGVILDWVAYGNHVVAVHLTNATANSYLVSV